MRVRGCVFLVGVFALMGATALCAVIAYTTTQQAVVDLSARGLKVESPLEVAQLVINNQNALNSPANAGGGFEAFMQSQPTPTPTLTPTPAPPTATPRPGETPVPTQPIPTATIDPLAGYEINDPRRFTVLLLGIDQRTGVQDDEKYFRTDTMMVVSIDPIRKTAGVLSIPRDLWVSIPGFKEGRINTANALGDSNAYPGGGPALAAAAVEQALGMSVDKYILINFDVFTRVVDLLAPEGVEICVQEEIDDPYYPDAGYGFIKVHFDPGCQVLDAEKLLQYARTRKTEGGDFDRARRQHEVLQALREELLSAGGVANFVTQAPALWDELSGSFKTNLSLDELISLGLLAQDIPREDIHFGVIDNMSTTFAKTSSGDDVLIPNYGAIRHLIQQTFYPQTDLTLADLRQRAEAEGASIVVYNNTDIQGLAGQTRDWLTSQGVSVSNVGNIPQPDNRETTIRNYTDKTWTARYLAALLGISTDRIQRGGDGLTTADVMIAIGPDIQDKLTDE